MNYKAGVMVKVMVAAFFMLACYLPQVSAQQLLISESEKIDFAQGLRQQGQFSLAVTQFDEFVTQFPESMLLADAYLGAGECRFFLKEYDKAVEQFQNYLAKFPDGKDAGIARVRLAQSLYVQGKYDESLKQLNDVSLDVLPEAFKQTVHFFKGQILALQNNPTDAIASLQASAENTQSTAYSAQAFLKWGTLLAANDPNGALEKYAKSLEFADNSEIKASIALKQGEAYFLLRQYAQAESAFKSVVDAYPGLSVVTDAIANWYAALLAQKKYNEVIEHFNAQLLGAVDKPEYFQSYISVARALSLSGNIDAASGVFEKILGIAGLSESDKASVTLQKAKMFFENGKYPEVIAFIDGQTVTDNGVKLQMLLLKAKAQLSLKDYDNAWSVYEQLSRDFADSADASEAICGMAYVRYGQQQFEPAAGLFMECFSKKSDANERADALYNAFVSFRKAGLEDKTVEVAEQYIALTPPGNNLAEVVLSLSGIYSKRQMFDKANEILTPYLNDPDENKRRNAVFQSAYNLQLSGKTQEALKSYEAFMADGKNDRLTYLAHKNSIMMYLQDKNEEKAAELLGKAIVSFSDNDFPLKTYIWLVEHWQTKGDAAKMLEVLTMAETKYAQDPESAGIKFYRAQAFRMQDDCKQALENYDLAISGDTGVGYKGRARLGKGICLTGIGDYQGAEKELEQAVVDSPDDAFVAMRARFALANNATYMKNYDMAAKLYLVVDVLYNDAEYAPKALMRAGDILNEHLKNKKEAVNAYTKIVEVYPNSPEVQQAQEKIAQLK